MEHTIVELKHIFKRYHENEVLKDVSISFNASSIHSIVGENGAGKSTLTKILCGVIPKTKGSIIFDNKRVEFKSVRDAHNLGIRMVYQELFLMPDLTIAQDSYQIGYQAVQQVIKAAQGKPVTSNITTPGVWWDKNNYEELIEKKIVYHG